SRIQVNFRCDKMLRERIYQEENPSEWVRDACYQRLESESNPKYCDQQEKRCLAEAKEWKEKKKAGSQLSNSEDIISEFHQDPGKPQIYDSLSRNVCFNYFKTKYWPRIKNLPEFKLKNPGDIFNEILEEK
ncbi:unnamed protein product, partial [marine sediment metagenome]